MLHQNKWTIWPDECLCVPYESTQIGVGHGEARIAKLVDGAVSGQVSSYDIKDSNGNLWEVKEPSSTGMIRTGAKGTEVVSSILMKLSMAVDHLASGITFIEKHEKLENIIDAQGALLVKSFIENDIPLIKRGEVPTSRLWRFVTAMQVIRSSSNVKKDNIFITIENNNEQKRLSISESELVRINNILNINIDFSNDNKKTKLLSIFDDFSFKDPLTFVYDVWNAPASKTFLGVEGVILVHPEKGYYVIPKDDLDKKLKFYAISQSTPRYKVNIE